MKEKLLQNLQTTANEIFGEGSLTITTTINKDGTFMTRASIKGIPEIIEATDENKEEAEIKALDALQYITAGHLEKDMFPTKPLEEYQAINLSIADLKKDGGLIQEFLNNYSDKYDDTPQILVRNTGAEYECIIESNESNIHVRRTGEEILEAVESAVRLAISVMYPMVLTARDASIKID